MNIILITLGFQPFRTSGFDVSGERLVHALLEDGHLVTVIAAADGDIKETMIHKRLKIYRLPIGVSDWIGYAFRANRLLNTLGSFDVVHFWDIHFAYTCPRRFVATLHQSFRQRMEGIEHGELQGSMHRKRRLYYAASRYLVEPFCLRKAAGLMAVSASTKREFVDFYKIPKEKISLTRHGLDVNFFKPYGNQKETRAHIGILPHEPVILFSGFITPRKGLEYLAKAFPGISPSPRLVIVGKWRDESYRRMVIDLFRPFSERVIELGFVQDDYLPELYSMADVYVSGSLVEGFGLPLGEALACGTPVVAFDAGATSEVVGPGGILVPPKDSSGLATAISTMLQNPGIRRSMAEFRKRACAKGI